MQVVGCRLHVAGEICFNFEFVFEFGSDFEFYLSFVIWFLVLSKLIADLTAVVAFPFEFRVSGFRLPQFLFGSCDLGSWCFAPSPLSATCNSSLILSFSN